MLCPLSPFASLSQRGERERGEYCYAGGTGVSVAKAAYCLALEEATMGRGGVPGWMKPPKPFPSRKISLPPGYKRNGYQVEQECGGGKYTGEWKDGHMHGRGEFKFMREGKERGDRYGKCSSSSPAFLSLRLLFVLLWQCLRWVCNTVLVLKTESGTVGEWSFSKQHGKGVYHYRNLDRYDGEWANGQKHGHGTMFLANGDKYEGEWRNGERQGRGRWTGANGNTYVHLLQSYGFYQARFTAAAAAGAISEYGPHS